MPVAKRGTSLGSAEHLIRFHSLIPLCTLPTDTHLLFTLLNGVSLVVNVGTSLKIALVLTLILAVSTAAEKVTFQRIVTRKNKRPNALTVAK